MREALAQRKPVAAVRPGAARIQVANLPSIDWAANRPASAQHKHAPPVNYFESNPTLDKQLAAYAQATPTAAAAAAMPAQAQAQALPPLPDTLTMAGSDPFAASAAYTGGSINAPAQPPANGALPDVPKGAWPMRAPEVTCKCQLGV